MRADRNALVGRREGGTRRSGAAAEAGHRRRMDGQGGPHAANVRRRTNGTRRHGAARDTRGRSLGPRHTVPVRSGGPRRLLDSGRIAETMTAGASPAVSAVARASLLAPPFLGRQFRLRTLSSSNA
jgi:hypothetical protein